MSSSSLSAFLLLIFVSGRASAEVPDQCFAQQQEFLKCNETYTIIAQPRSYTSNPYPVESLPPDRDWFHLKVTEYFSSDARCPSPASIVLHPPNSQTVYYKHGEKYTQVDDLSQTSNPATAITTAHGESTLTYEIYIPYSDVLSSMQGQRVPGTRFDTTLTFIGFQDIEILRWPTKKMGATVFTGALPCGTFALEEYDYISGKLEATQRVRVKTPVAPNLPTFWPFEFHRTNASDFNVKVWNVSNVTSIHPLSYHPQWSTIFSQSTFPRGFFALRWNTLEILNLAHTVLITKQDLADMKESHFPNTQLAFQLFNFAYLDTTNLTDFQLLTFPQARRIVKDPFTNVKYVTGVTKDAITETDVREFQAGAIQPCIYQEYKARSPVVEELTPVPDQDVCRPLISTAAPAPSPTPSLSTPSPSSSGPADKSWRQAAIGCIVWGIISSMLATGFAIAWLVDRRPSKDDRDAPRYSRLDDDPYGRSNIISSTNPNSRYARRIR
jgi:hypothetical protein